MTLVNALGSLSLEATQLALLAELQQKLEPGQSVVVSSVGGTVTVAGTVALDATTLAALEAIDVRQSGAWTVTVTDGGGSVTVDGTVTALGPLTDTQLRASAVPVTGPLTDAQLRAAVVPVSVSNFPVSQTVTGPLTDAQLRALAVAVSGTVALDAPTLAALESITAAVTGSVTVTNFPGTQPVSGPLTDTQLRAAPLGVTDNAGSLTTDGSFDERYSGGKSAYASTVASVGDTTLITPAAGKRLRVVWACAIPSPDNTGANRVRLKFGAGGSPFYETYALAHWEVFDGVVDVPLIVNLQTAEPVSITVHYKEIT